MANPKISSKTKKAIEAKLRKGLTHREISESLGVSGGVISNVKGSIGLGNDVLLIRTKKELAATKEKLRSSLREIDSLQRDLSLAGEIRDYSRIFRPVSIKPKRGGRGEATAVICVNDWHVEERINKEAVNGANEFDLEIATKRIEKLWATSASLVDMCRTRSRIDSIIVCVLGDLISGYIHDELTATNSLTPGEAVLFVFDQLVSGLEFLKRETKAKEILVPCVCGNHGRMTKRIWAKKGPGMSLENILYNLLARWFIARKDKVIRLIPPQGDMTYLDIYGRIVRVTHGDAISYRGGIAGVHIPLRKALDTAWNTYKRADYNYIGHWHTDLTGEDYRISGALCGVSEWSIRCKARYQKPSQAFEIHHPKYGATARFPMILE